MVTRKTRTTRTATKRHSAAKVSRPWSSQECAFMRKFYRRFETAWVARQLGRTVYSVRYKAVDLSLKKATPSVWRGNKGAANAFKASTAMKRKTTGRPATRRTTRSKTWRASTRKTTRTSRTRRTIKKRK